MTDQSSNQVVTIVSGLPRSGTSMMMKMLAEGGVPFLLLLASVALWSVGPAFRSVWGLGLLFVFLHALVDYPMQRLGLAAWVFVLLGTLAAEERGRSRAAAP